MLELRLATKLTLDVEWIISLVFTFYVLSFSVDLFPAAKDKQFKSNYGQGELGNQKLGVGHELLQRNGSSYRYTNGREHERSAVNGAHPAHGDIAYTESAVTGVDVGDGLVRPIAAQNF